MTENRSLSPEQRDAALHALVGADPGAVVEAALLLSEDASTTSQLVQLLETQSRPEVRQGILYALCWHGQPGLWDLMVEVLSNPREDPKVRGQAAEGLSYLFSYLTTDSREFTSGVNALLEALNDSSVEVRYCAVHALGATGHPPLIPVLERMREDPTPAPGWIGTVADEARRALEFLEGAHSMRKRRGR